MVFFRMKQERQIVARYACLTPSCNHPGNFIAIASIVLEICTGQNSSMKIKSNNSKFKQARVKVHVHCKPPPPLLDEIYHPQNFITIASIVLEICTGQNSSLKIKKGQKLKNKQARVHVDCTPPRWDLSTHKISIASIVLEICSGQRTGRSPPAMGDHIIRPVFHVRIKILL